MRTSGSFRECCVRSVEAGRLGGKKSRSYKLTRSQVLEARRLREQKVTWEALAKMFGVSTSGIQYAVKDTKRNYPETLH